MSPRKLRPRPDRVRNEPVPTRTAAPSRQGKARDRFIDMVHDAAVHERYRLGKRKGQDAATQHATGSTELLFQALGEHNVHSLLKDTSAVWQHGSVNDVYNMPVPEAVEALGARLCTAKAETLKTLEAFISKHQRPIEGNYMPRIDGKINIALLAEYDATRFEYRSLLLDLIIEVVNAERLRENPQSLGLTLVETSRLNWDDKTIIPLDSFTIYDQDLKSPAMTLYLPSERAAERLGAPRPRYHEAHRAEVALQMKLNDKLSFQGMAFDGVRAPILLLHVDRLQDNLAQHKTHFGFTSYCFPEQRNVFVADMVKLLQYHIDHRMAYDKILLIGRWDPRKYPAGGIKST